MAITSVGAGGNNIRKVNSFSMDIVSSGAGGNGSWLQGELVVVLVAADNVGTTDGDLGEFTSVQYILSSVPAIDFIKIGEFTNGQGAALGGATISAWAAVVPAGAAGGTDVIRITEASATPVALAACCWRFTIDQPNFLVVTPTGLANDAADPGSMTLSGLVSREYLFVRAITGETSATTVLTPTANHTAITGTQTAGGSSPTNMAVRGEFRILTGTSDTSDPTFTAVDCASVFGAIFENPVPYRNPMPPLLAQ